jgi:hypothetical protein
LQSANQECQTEDNRIINFDRVLDIIKNYKNLHESLKDINSEEALAQFLIGKLGIEKNVAET